MEDKTLIFADHVADFMIVKHLQRVGTGPKELVVTAPRLSSFAARSARSSELLDVVNLSCRYYKSFVRVGHALKMSVTAWCLSRWRANFLTETQGSAWSAAPAQKPMKCASPSGRGRSVDYMQLNWKQAVWAKVRSTYLGSSTRLSSHSRCRGAVARRRS